LAGREGDPLTTPRLGAFVWFVWFVGKITALRDRTDDGDWL